MFLLQKETSEESVHECMDALRDQWGLDRADFFLLSFPGVVPDVGGVDKVYVPPGMSEAEAIAAQAADDVPYWASVWRQAEALRSDGRLDELGVCEFGVRRLRALRAAVQHPPSASQIKVSDCCHLPQDLITYAYDHGMKLFNNNDSTAQLDTASLTEMLAASSTLAASCIAGIAFRPTWVCKYTVFVKYRGVVEHKGYALAGESGVANARYIVGARSV